MNGLWLGPKSITNNRVIKESKVYFLYEASSQRQPFNNQLFHKDNLIFNLMNEEKIKQFIGLFSWNEIKLYYNSMGNTLNMI